VETRYKIRSADAAISLEDYLRMPKHPVAVVLDNIRSAYNVGSIFRSADAARIERVLPCGVTAHPPHLKLEKTAVGTDRYVKSEYFKSTLDAVASERARGARVVALETAENAKCYHEMTYPRPLCLVLGNEALGVSAEVLDAADEVVRIPLFGYKNSLNVVCAFNVVLFEALRQWKMDLPAPPLDYGKPEKPAEEERRPR
jgi:23S rRNA (guanosine2251-2'-O)-methyltransferase